MADDHALNAYECVAEVRMRDVRHLDSDVLFRAMTHAIRIGDTAVMFMARAELTRRDVEPRAVVDPPDPRSSGI